MKSWWFSLLLLACCTQSVRAQGNDLLTPVGGRSALMGNTGVALARDSAAPFYNPAAIVRIVDKRLAFSVNFYSLSFMHYSDFQAPGPVDAGAYGDARFDDTGLFDSTFRVLPTSLCLFFTLSDLKKLSGGEPEESKGEPMPGSKLALCFASLESEDFDLQAVRFSAATSAGTIQHVQSLARRWSRYYIGPTYSTWLGPKLALGGALQAVYTHNSFAFDSSVVGDRLGGGSIASDFGSSGSGSSFDVTAVLGATYELAEWTLGASVRVPSIHLAGGYDGAFNRTTSGADADTSVAISGNGSMRASTPLRAALGAGVQWGRLTLELDGALVVPLGNALSAELSETEARRNGNDASVELTRSSTRYSVPTHLTFNPSFGVEYFTSTSSSILGGVSANFSTLDSLRSQASVGNLIQARTNHVSASLGMGSYWNGGELLFGLQADFGWGESLAVNAYAIPSAWSVVSMQTYALTFIVAGATNLKSIARVVRTITGDNAE